MRRSILFILLSLISLNIKAQEQTDSVLIFADIDRDYHFKPKQVIIPTACAIVGAWGVENKFLVKQKERLQDKIAVGHKIKADDYIQYLPAVMDLALPLMGVEGRLPYREKALVVLNSEVILTTIVQGTKHLVNEKRPDCSTSNSFPSGHTATAFAGAEMIRLEYGGWYGTAAYVCAGLTAAGRIYNNRHWANDVLAGAGIGILSTRAAYWLLPLERKWLGWEKGDNKTMLVLPYYSSGNGGHFGASMALTF